MGSGRWVVPPIPNLAPKLNLTWAMASGKLEVGSNKWAVTSGQRALASSKLAVASGQWQVGSGKWAVGDLKPYIFTAEFW